MLTWHTTSCPLPLENSDIFRKDEWRFFFLWRAKIFQSFFQIIFFVFFKQKTNEVIRAWQTKKRNRHNDLNLTLTYYIHTYMFSNVLIFFEKDEFIFFLFIYQNLLVIFSDRFLISCFEKKKKKIRIWMEKRCRDNELNLTLTINYVYIYILECSDIFQKKMNSFFFLFYIPKFLCPFHPSFSHFVYLEEKTN